MSKVTKKSNPLLNICNQLIEIDDKHFEEMQTLANQCVSYSHPLKPIRAAKINLEGEHDLLILAKLKELKALIVNKPHRDNAD
jgi:hypothetical protein